MYRNVSRHLRMIGLLLCIVLVISACSQAKNSNSDTQNPLPSEISETEEAPSSQPDTEPQSTEVQRPSDGSVDLGGFAVSTSTSEATLVGMQVLSSGGNAVDAAAAISFMLSVSEPYSSGIGGGGLMLIYDSKTGEAFTLDYYGCAGSAPEPVDSIAIPGLVAGMDEALRRWGTISLADALEPAVDYAEEGFTVSDAFIFRLNYSDSLRTNPAFTDLRAGDILQQKELAETFRKIQTEGAQSFYRGSIAQDIVSCCNLTAEDLSNYQVQVRDVVRSEFAGYQILGTYGPSSALTVCQMLKIAEMLNIPSPQTDPNGYLNVLKTATTVAFNSRKAHVVDPAFYSFKPKKYLKDDYLQGRIDQLTANTWEDDNERFCTTQFAVIDRDGLVVCVTNSLSDSWGSYRCVDGFYLNDTLSNFSNSGKNAYEPGKRPRTHFSPIICLGSDGQIMTIGTPGGLEIPKLLATVLIDVLREGTDVQTAVDKARVFYDSDGALCIESDEIHPSVLNVADVSELYYTSSSHLIFGCTSVVGYKPDSGVYAVCDLRRETAKAMVYNDND